MDDFESRYQRQMSCLQEAGQSEAKLLHELLETRREEFEDAGGGPENLPQFLEAALDELKGWILTLRHELWG